MQAIAWLITALLLLYSITLFTLAILTNLWNRDSATSSGGLNEKESHTNAFFSDAANLRFFCAPLLSKYSTKKETKAYVKTPMPMPVPVRRDSKFAPQFEGTHQFWNEISLSSDVRGNGARKSEGRESRLERGYSSSTVGSNGGSITKNYVPSPLSSSVGLGQPRRAVLPSQSPYMTTKKATAANMAFVPLDDGKQFRA